MESPLASAVTGLFSPPNVAGVFRAFLSGGRTWKMCRAAVLP
jgi:hypothetical protein